METTLQFQAPEHLKAPLVASTTLATAIGHLCIANGEGRVKTTVQTSSAEHAISIAKALGYKLVEASAMR